MRVKDFEYHAPATIADACALLAQYGDGAAVISGGTDLIVDLKGELVERDHIISLKNIDELKGISFDDKAGLSIGSTSTHSRVAEHPLVRAYYPAVAEAAASVGSVQVRNRGSIGGNIVSAVPSADTPPALIAYGAEVKLVSPRMERWMPLEEFFIGPRRTALESAEILTQIRLPVQPKHTGGCYVKYALRDATALAVAGVAAVVTLESGKCESAAIALGAVAPTPIIARRASAAMTGRTPDDEAVAAVAGIARDEAKPISDIRGSVEYRRDLVEVLTQRALRCAIDRAKQRKRQQSAN